MLFFLMPGMRMLMSAVLFTHWMLVVVFLASAGVSMLVLVRMSVPMRMGVGMLVSMLLFILMLMRMGVNMRMLMFMLMFMLVFSSSHNPPPYVISTFIIATGRIVRQRPRKSVSQGNCARMAWGGLRTTLSFALSIAEAIAQQTKP